MKSIDFLFLIIIQIIKKKRLQELLLILFNIQKFIKSFVFQEFLLKCLFQIMQNSFFNK